MRYAVLVDGGFIRLRIGSSKAPMTAEVFGRFIDHLKTHAALTAGTLHRVYYYDAKPYRAKAKQPLSGETIDFAATGMAERMTRLHSDLERLPFVALREGEVTLNGWKVKSPVLNRARGPELKISVDDLKPNIQQKGVDMRIGLDIAALTLKKQTSAIVLVTGDSDLVPAMKFARREGSQLFLVPLRHGLREPMYAHSDLVIDIDPRGAWNPTAPAPASPAIATGRGSVASPSGRQAAPSQPPQEPAA